MKDLKKLKNLLIVSFNMDITIQMDFVFKIESGIVKFTPVWCEATGVQIGWKTLSEVPKYISLNVLSWDGKIRNQQLIEDMFKME